MMLLCKRKRPMSLTIVIQDQMYIYEKVRCKMRLDDTIKMDSKCV